MATQRAGILYGNIKQLTSTQVTQFIKLNYYTLEIAHIFISAGDKK